LTYLLTQIFISLLLAGLAGGAFGWILHGFKANQRERELKSTLARHNTALAQAQQERQMIADDYDEMKIGLESRISELQYENRKLPDLEENLEKKKHDAETGELATLNNELHDELEILKASNAGNTGNKNTGAAARTQALYNTQAGSGSNSNSAATSPASARSVSTVATTASTIASTSRQPEEKAQRSDIGKTGNSKPNRAGTVAAGATAAMAAVAGTHATRTKLSPDNTADTLEHNADVNLKGSGAPAAKHTAVDPTDNVSPGVSTSTSMGRLQEEMIADTQKHWDDEASEQKELLALESEIEEMRAMDAHLTNQGGDDIEHERGLDRDQMEEADAIDLARDIDEELAAPVIAGNVESPSAAQANIKPAPTVTDVSNDAEDESDKLRESLREKFSSKSDDDADDLQIIHGIGPVIERSLNDIGITNFNQLATLTRQEIEEVAEILKIFPGRIERDNWIGNARRLVSTDANATSATDSGSSHSKPDKEELENA